MIVGKRYGDATTDTVLSVHFLLLSVANGSKKCNGNASMSNEHYVDERDKRIFLFRSKDGIKTMRICRIYTLNQGVKQWISKKSRETTFLVSAEWNLARSSRCHAPKGRKHDLSRCAEAELCDAASDEVQHFGHHGA